MNIEGHMVAGIVHGIRTLVRQANSPQGAPGIRSIDFIKGL